MHSYDETPQIWLQLNNDSFPKTLSYPNLNLHVIRQLSSSVTEDLLLDCSLN